MRDEAMATAVRVGPEDERRGGGYSGERRIRHEPLRSAREGPNRKRSGHCGPGRRRSGWPPAGQRIARVGWESDPGRPDLLAAAAAASTPHRRFPAAAVAPPHPPRAAEAEHHAANRYCREAVSAQDCPLPVRNK